MKQINDISPEQKEVLKFSLENTNPNDQRLSITVKDLREIDKLCKIIEEGESTTLEFEDADFTYLKNKFERCDIWNPQARQIVLEVADLLEGVK